MSWSSDLVVNASSLRSLHAVHDSLPQAIIFTGPKGVGGFTLASQLAKSLSKNILTIGRTDDSIKVSDIRDIISFTKTRSTSTRIILIDNADRMTKSAQNAFLKVLEEPVSNTHFILVAHNIQQLTPTIRSRCQELNIHPVDSKSTEEFISTLNIQDATMRKQIEFIAGGLPAEIHRLATDESYFEQASTDMKSIQTLLQGTAYEKITLIQSLKDDRAKSINLIEKSISVLRRLLMSQPRPELIRKLDNMITASSRIQLGANVRLQLLSAASISDRS